MCEIHAPVRSSGLLSSPAGYFLKADEGTGLLPWSHAVEQLVAAHNYWLATASASGVPHAMPVWGVWLADRLLFSTSPESRKARNIAANEKVVLHLESGADLVVVEGIARGTTEPADIKAYIDSYNPKYDWDFTPEQLTGGVYSFRPARGWAWLDDHDEGFRSAGTRFDFED